MYRIVIMIDPVEFIYSTASASDLMGGQIVMTGAGAPGETLLELYLWRPIFIEWWERETGHDDYFRLGWHWARNSIGFRLFRRYICSGHVDLPDYINWKNLSQVRDGPLPYRRFETIAYCYQEQNPKASHAPRCDTVLTCS